MSEAQHQLQYIPPKFFDEDPSDSSLKAYSQAVRGGGLRFDVQHGAIPNDGSEILTLTGITDRLTVGIADLRAVDPANAVFPLVVEWGVCIGTGCILDRRQLVSGPAPDVMNLLNAQDVRTGILWSIQSPLVGRWSIFAAIRTANPGTKLRGIISILSDRGGGSAVTVYKGGVFG